MDEFMPLGELWEDERVRTLDIVRNHQDNNIEALLPMYVSVHKRKLSDENLGGPFHDDVFTHEFPVIHVTDSSKGVTVNGRELHIMLDYGESPNHDDYFAQLKITYEWDKWNALKGNQFYRATSSRVQGHSRSVGDIIDWAIHWARDQGGYNITASNCHMFSNHFMRDIVGYDTSGRGHSRKDDDFDFTF